MSLYNAHWPFVLALQQTATVNELLNPDVQLEEAVLKWNQDFSLFTWLTLESPDRGCITFINSRKRPYRSPKSQTLKKERHIKDALFIWKTFWWALGMNARWRVHEMWRSEVSVLIIVVVGQLVPGPYGITIGFLWAQALLTVQYTVLCYSGLGDGGENEITMYWTRRGLAGCMCSWIFRETEYLLNSSEHVV